MLYFADPLALQEMDRERRVHVLAWYQWRTGPKGRRTLAPMTVAELWSRLVRVLRVLPWVKVKGGSSA
ncbi:MAG: hypothetical protein GY925_26405 [Actinomycetia bacterium]|nr:hypothetical protein [Actinomycetes bacterium]